MLELGETTLIGENFFHKVESVRKVSEVVTYAVPFDSTFETK